MTEDVNAFETKINSLREHEKIMRDNLRTQRKLVPKPQETEKSRRDRLFIGTMPEEIFDSEDAQTCHDFIEFMSKHRFRDSVKLKGLRRGVLSAVLGAKRPSVRGYIIGYAHPALDDRRPVLLCSDGTLREYDWSEATSLSVNPSGGIIPPSIGYFKRSGSSYPMAEGYPGEISSSSKTFYSQNLESRLINIARKTI